MAYTYFYTSFINTFLIDLKSCNDKESIKKSH